MFHFKFATGYAKIAKNTYSAEIYIPIENDNTIYFSRLQYLFPGISGLIYNTNFGLLPVHCDGDRVYPPGNNWSNRLYYCQYPFEVMPIENNWNIVETQIRVKCDQLIVLGLPASVTSDRLHEYFTHFGLVLLANVKQDATAGISKRYGFVTMSTAKEKNSVLRRKHLIDRANITVRYTCCLHDPITINILYQQRGEELTSMELRTYFKVFGQIEFVFISRMHKSYAIINFFDENVTNALIGTIHQIKGRFVQVDPPPSDNITISVPTSYEVPQYFQYTYNSSTINRNENDNPYREMESTNMYNGISMEHLPRNSYYNIMSNRNNEMLNPINQCTQYYDGQRLSYVPFQSTPAHEITPNNLIPAATEYFHRSEINN